MEASTKPRLAHTHQYSVGKPLRVRGERERQEEAADSAGEGGEEACPCAAPMRPGDYRSALGSMLHWLAMPVCPELAFSHPAQHPLQPPTPHRNVRTSRPSRAEGLCGSGRSQCDEVNSLMARARVTPAGACRERPQAEQGLRGARRPACQHGRSRALAGTLPRSPPTERQRTGKGGGPEAPNPPGRDGGLVQHKAGEVDEEQQEEGAHAAGAGVQGRAGRAQQRGHSGGRKERGLLQLPADLVATVSSRHTAAISWNRAMDQMLMRKSCSLRRRRGRGRAEVVVARPGGGGGGGGEGSPDGRLLPVPPAPCSGPSLLTRT